MGIEVNRRAVLLLTVVGVVLIYLTHGYWWNQTSPGFGLLRAGVDIPGLKVHQTWMTTDMIPIPESVNQQTIDVKVQDSHITFPFEKKVFSNIHKLLIKKYVYKLIYHNYIKER